MDGKDEDTTKDLERIKANLPSKQMSEANRLTLQKLRGLFMRLDMGKPKQIHGKGITVELMRQQGHLGILVREMNDP